MPKAPGRTRVGERVTEVILAMFRASGLLLEAGDRLAANEGMTAARWQVLGSIELAGHPLTVPQIARRMGLTRQTVHVTVKQPAAERLVQPTPRLPVPGRAGRGRMTVKVAQRLAEAQAAPESGWQAIASQILVLIHLLGLTMFVGSILDNIVLSLGAPATGDPGAVVFA